MEVLLELTSIAGSHETLEGNSFTYHETTLPAPELLTKQENLRNFARNKKAILEIGFNAGHSAALFCEANPDLELICVDIGIHKYVQPCYEHLRQKYGDRIQLIVSSSLELTNLSELQSKLKYFDGIHIDGNHVHPWVITDTMSCLRFLADKAQLIVDDSNMSHIKRWVDFLTNSILFEPAPGYLPSVMYEHVILNFNRPTVGICSMAIGEQYRVSVWKCMESLEKYCSKWNIPLFTTDQSLDSTRPIPWSKIRLLQKHLDSVDVLLWIDADILITNPEHSLDERLIFLTKNHDILISADWAVSTNTGSFVIRNCPTSKALLEEVYNRTEFINHDWWEQTALVAILNGSPEKRNRVRMLPRTLARLINAYPRWFEPLAPHDNSDWLIHFAGARGADLPNHIDRFSKEITEHRGLNMHNLTNLVQVVELFW
jgi:hypothetical protein